MYTLILNGLNRLEYLYMYVIIVNEKGGYGFEREKGCGYMGGFGGW